MINDKKYYLKYLKYKEKYVKLQNQLGGKVPVYQIEGVPHENYLPYNYYNIVVNDRIISEENTEKKYITFDCDFKLIEYDIANLKEEINLQNIYCFSNILIIINDDNKFPFHACYLDKLHNYKFFIPIYDLCKRNIKIPDNKLLNIFNVFKSEVVARGEDDEAEVLLWREIGIDRIEVSTKYNLFNKYIYINKLRELLEILYDDNIINKKEFDIISQHKFKDIIKYLKNTDDEINEIKLKLIEENQTLIKDTEQISHTMKQTKDIECKKIYSDELAFKKRKNKENDKLIKLFDNLLKNKQIFLQFYYLYDKILKIFDYNITFFINFNDMMYLYKEYSNYNYNELEPFIYSRSKSIEVDYYGPNEIDRYFKNEILDIINFRESINEIDKIDVKSLYLNIKLSHIFISNYIYCRLFKPILTESFKPYMFNGINITNLLENLFNIQKLIFNDEPDFYKDLIKQGNPIFINPEHHFRYVKDGIPKNSYNNCFENAIYIFTKIMCFNPLSDKYEPELLPNAIIEIKDLIIKINQNDKNKIVDEFSQIMLDFINNTFPNPSNYFSKVDHELDINYDQFSFLINKLLGIDISTINIQRIEEYKFKLNINEFQYILYLKKGYHGEIKLINSVQRFNSKYQYNQIVLLCYDILTFFKIIRNMPCYFIINNEYIGTIIKIFNYEKIIYISNNHNNIITLTSSEGILNYIPFDILIKNKFNPNYIDENGNSILNLLINRNDGANVYEIIKLGANINYINNDLSLLNLAIINGFTAIAKFLIEQGIDLNYIDKNCNLLLYSALINCIQNKMQGVAEILIRKGIDCNFINNEGESLLYLSIYHKNTSVAETLIKLGANINFINSKCNSLLKLAIETHDKFIAKMLINKGIDLKIINDNGTSFLNLAIKYKMEEIALLLINKGCDVNYIDNKCNSVLYLAIKRCTEEFCVSELETVVSLLIDKGADINFIDNDGNSLLHFVINEELSNVAELLINKGADPNFIDKDGESLLNLAIYTKNQNIGKKLIDKGANINYINKNGHPIIYVVLTLWQSFANIIMNYSAFDNVNYIDTEGNSLLNISIQKKMPDIPEILIKKGANVNHIDKNGNTIFTITIKNNMLHLINLLVEYGLDSSIIDKNDYFILYSFSTKIIKINEKYSQFLNDDAADDEYSKKLSFFMNNEEYNSIITLLLEIYNSNETNIEFYSNKKEESIYNYHTNFGALIVLSFIIENELSTLYYNLFNYDSDHDNIIKKGPRVYNDYVNIPFIFKFKLLTSMLDNLFNNFMNIFIRLFYDKQIHIIFKLMCPKENYIYIDWIENLKQHDIRESKIYENIISSFRHLSFNTSFISDATGFFSFLFLNRKQMFSRDYFYESSNTLSMIELYILSRLHIDPSDFNLVILKNTENVETWNITQESIKSPISNLGIVLPKKINLRTNDKVIYKNINFIENRGQILKVLIYLIFDYYLKFFNNIELIKNDDVMKDINSLIIKRLKQIEEFFYIDLDLHEIESYIIEYSRDKTFIKESLLDRIFRQTNINEALIKIDNTKMEDIIIDSMFIFNHELILKIISSSYIHKNGFEFDICIDNNLNIVNAFIKYAKNVDLQLTYINDKTVLIIAIENDNIDFVKLLLEKGANINLVTTFGTPLMYCIQNKKLEILKLLLGKNPDLNIQDYNGNTALHYACKKGIFIDILICLLEKKPDLNIQDGIGNTALHYASELKWGKTFKLLLEMNPDLNRQNLKGETALHILCKDTNYGNIKLLLGKNPDLNIQDLNGDTALFIAVKKNDILIINLLLNECADRNIKNNEGMTALEYAIGKNYTKIIELFS